MMFKPNIINRVPLGFVLFLSSNAEAVPLLITQASDGVEIQEGETKKPAPKQAFLLLDNQKLLVAKDASAVVLSQDQASKVVGPRIFGTDFTHPDVKIQNVTETSRYLEKKSSNRSIAATRGSNDAKVLHPKPDHSIIQLQRIEIDCHNCSEVSYEILQMPELNSVHAYKGSPSAKYSGPELQPGEYALQFNDNFFGFVIDNGEKTKSIAKTIQATRTLTATLSEVDALSIEAGIWFQEGFYSEAFYAVEQGLQKHPNDENFKKLYLQYYNPSKISQ